MTSSPAPPISTGPVEPDPKQAVDREQPGANPAAGDEERAADDAGRGSLVPEPRDSKTIQRNEMPSPDTSGA
jgi:hypothetical protein